MCTLAPLVLDSAHVGEAMLEGSENLASRRLADWG